MKTSIAKSLVLFLTFAICFGSVAWGQPAHETAGLGQHRARHNPSEAHPEFPVELSFGMFWESRYVSEGRDNLDGDGLASAELSAVYSGISLGAWAADGPDAEYREYNYWLGYSYEWDQFTFSVGYTFLDFASDDSDDQEYSAEVAYACESGFELIVGGYYSDESGGVFYEATLSKEIEWAEGLSIFPFGTLGFNDGYIVEGHDGLNHAVLGVELVYELHENVSFGGFIAGNVAIDADRDRHADDDGLRDFVYSGVSLNVSY